MSIMNSPANEALWLQKAAHSGQAVNDVATAGDQSLKVENPIMTRRAEHQLEQEQEPNSQTKLRLWKRRFTMLPQARAEPRPYTNKYFCKRPVLLQYYHQGALVDSTGRHFAATRGEELMMPSSISGGEGEENEYVETDGATSMKQRDWLNLFIDLLWVGILSNVGSEFVAHAYVEEDWGNAFLEFLILYLTAFRFWTYLRKFLNNYFSKDILQSVFISWCLVLALLFGNQTTYFLTGGGNIVIWTYLVVRGSFFWIEALYCIFIPQVRREFMVTSAITIPIAAIWGVAAAIEWPTRAVPTLIALSLEGLVSTLLVSPIGEWLLRGAPRKAIDAENLVDRLQGFFVIVLGEGVFPTFSNFLLYQIALEAGTK